MEKTDVKKMLKELYQPTHKEFGIVDVPNMKFAMIDGQGDPGTEVYMKAVQWLYSTIYPIKFIAKKKWARILLRRL